MIVGGLLMTVELRYWMILRNGFDVGLRKGKCWSRIYSRIGWRRTLGLTKRLYGSSLCWLDNTPALQLSVSYSVPFSDVQLGAMLTFRRMPLPSTVASIGCITDYQAFQSISNKNAHFFELFCGPELERLGVWDSWFSEEISWYEDGLWRIDREEGELLQRGDVRLGIELDGRIGGMVIVTYVSVIWRVWIRMKVGILRARAQGSGNLTIYTGWSLIAWIKEVWQRNSNHHETKSMRVWNLMNLLKRFRSQANLCIDGSIRSIDPIRINWIGLINPIRLLDWQSMGLIRSDRSGSIHRSKFANTGYNYALLSI